MREYTILDSRWFTPAQSFLGLDVQVGIVAIRTNDHEPGAPDEWKAYIGFGMGMDANTDRQTIAARGAGLSPEEAAGFFPQLDIKRYKRDGTSNEGVVEAGEEFRR